MTHSEAQRIVDGYYQYAKCNFKRFNRLGYFKVTVSKAFRVEGKFELSVQFGAGWGNQPWGDELLDFFRDLNLRVKAKYPQFHETSMCGYTSSDGIASLGGMISERLLREQMSYPERY